MEKKMTIIRPMVLLTHRIFCPLFQTTDLGYIAGRLCTEIA